MDVYSSTVWPKVITASASWLIRICDDFVVPNGSEEVLGTLCIDQSLLRLCLFMGNVNPLSWLFKCHGAAVE